MRAALIALVLILSPGLAQAYEKSTPKAAPTPTPSLPDLRGQTFAAARAKLFALGWERGPSQNDRNKCSIGREDVCAAHPFETLYCSGSGRAYCGFMYHKDEHLVLMRTQGEELSGLRVVNARVLSKRDREKNDRGELFE